jgi:hypothetical protein
MSQIQLMAMAVTAAMRARRSRRRTRSAEARQPQREDDRRVEQIEQAGGARDRRQRVHERGAIQVAATERDDRPGQAWTAGRVCVSSVQLSV